MNWINKLYFLNIINENKYVTYKEASTARSIYLPRVVRHAEFLPRKG